MNPILTHFNLSQPQEQAVQTRFKDVVVSAGAGTGKTRTLVARYLSLLADDIPLREIVAITFTRKAAREMRNRVRSDIGRYLAQTDLESAEYKIWQTHQNELDAARIGTIHNLCGEILRNHPAEARIDPRFDVLDEVQSALLLNEAIEATLAWAVQTAVRTPDLGPGITRLFSLMSERQVQDLIRAMLFKQSVMTALLETLSPAGITDHWQAQLRAIQQYTLERLTAEPRWQESVALLRENVPMNSNDKQADQRLMVLNAISETAGKSLEEQLRQLSRLNEINLVGGSGKSWPGGTDQLKMVKDALKTLRRMWQNASLLSLSLNEQDETLAAVMPTIFRLFNYANQRYGSAKVEREALDFDDLEGLAVKLLADNAAVRDYWQSQIQALLVDEFQDTNEQQRQFIRLLCPEPGKLFIVGDAKQSIYRFRGADVTVFQAEREGIKSSGGRAINLDTSYRAHNTLLEGMNSLLKPVLGEDSPQRPAYVAPFDRLEAANKTLPDGLPAPFVEFHLALGNKGEALPVAAAGLAARLTQLQQNTPLDFGDMAILCRASSAFQYYENALDTAGIPYLTVAGKGFYDRPEIRDLLNALHATADPHDDLALAGFLRSPGCGLSDEALFHLAQARLPERSLWETIRQGFQLSETQTQKRLQWAADLLSELHQMSGRTRVADLLKIFLDKTNYLAALRLAGQPRALRNVGKLLTDVHNSELVNVVDFLAYAASLKDSGSREGEARSTAGGAVQIMSIHAAKGLEFPLVVLGDAAAAGSNRSQNIFIDPELGVLLGYEGQNGQKAAVYELAKQLNSQQDTAESDRLLYVALTRAQQILMISGHGSATKAGRLSLKGWLGQLADITELSSCTLADYNETGERSVPFDLAVDETAVRATLYEPNFRPIHIITTPDKMEITQETLNQVHQNLAFPISRPPLEMLEPETPNRVWQVVPTAIKPQAPAWLIGTLVHEAIALWRFPDKIFDRWVEAGAASRGLTDKQQLIHAIKETRELLERFKKWDKFPEIEQAQQRFHELPYSYDSGDRIETGYIDLLYRYDGRWTIVDFKTDEIKHESEIDEILEKGKYKEQISRYGTAVKKLAREHPRLIICLLNGPEGVITKEIS